MYTCSIHAHDRQRTLLFRAVSCSECIVGVCVCSHAQIYLTRHRMTSLGNAVAWRASQYVHRSTCHDASHAHTSCLVMTRLACLGPVLHLQAIVNTLTRVWLLEYQGHLHEVVHCFCMSRMSGSDLLARSSTRTRVLPLPSFPTCQRGKP